MDINAECAHCLLERVLFQARLAGNGREFESVAAAIGALRDGFRKGRVSAAVSTEVHKAAYAAMGVRDPYRDLKVRSDAVAGEFVSEAERAIAESDDPFYEAALMAVIGNVMDFGSGIAIDRPEEFRGEFEALRSQGIGSDDTGLFKEAVSGAGRVLYFFDNCGESVFDRLLIDQIRSMGPKVVGVVRGEPILNDVTVEDAKRIGLLDSLDGLVTTGQFAIGADIAAAGDDLREELSKADLVVAKGMANYESFTGQDLGVPTVYLLRSKCAPVAESLGVPMAVNVVRYAARSNE
ncbi:MAG: DUF89 family protein [Thermoplasmatales archaeon]|nr:DUF89 family protein [Thermoplasmatales archaeon]